MDYFEINGTTFIRPYRGKRKDNHTWIKGDLLHGEKEIFIYCSPYFGPIVDPDTIGQAVGYTDDNGNEIFSGDIVRVSTSQIFTDFAVGYITMIDCKYVIKCQHYNLTFTEINAAHHGSIEIIGNIYDNIDLVEQYNLPMFV